MVPTLPLELQHMILDLALPPLTRKNLAKLRELMRSWPLVAPAWHAYLSAKVPVVPKIVLWETEHDLVAFERFQEVVVGAGRVVEHCELNMRQWQGKILEGHHLESALRLFKTAWVDLPINPCTWPLEHLVGLAHLSMNDDMDEEPPTLANRVNARLEHVALNRVSLRDVDLNGSLLKSILFNECFEMDSQILGSALPSLEIFGIAATRHAKDVLAARGTFPSSIRHILISFADNSSAQHSLITDITFPPTLKTLTIRHRPDDPPSQAISPSFLDVDLEHLREACIKSGTSLMVIKAPEDDSAFDLEAWALSVGG